MSFKLVLLNIFNGGLDETATDPSTAHSSPRSDKIADFFQRHLPDVVALTELNGWTNQILASRAAEWNHSYSTVMEKTNREFRLGITSKWPILEVRTWRDGFWHGALGVKIELPHDDMGGLWIIVTHLNPMSVPGRIEEAQKLVGAVQELGGERCVLVGDLNSLAKSDQRQYESKQVSDQMRGDAKLCRKFMQDEKIDYGVIECLENAGSLIDVGALYQRKFGGFGSSVPTMYGVDEMHAMPMRLDYIFASKDLLRHCKSCIIQNDPTTAALSDHYPVILELDFASTWLF